jgi:hypothetical protein
VSTLLMINRFDDLDLDRDEDREEWDRRVMAWLLLASLQSEPASSGLGSSTPTAT